MNRSAWHQSKAKQAAFIYCWWHGAGKSGTRDPGSKKISRAKPSRGQKHTKQKS